jgi:histidinol-phosphate aminotransferase
MHERLPFTRIVRELPSTVPFVPPEAMERERGRRLKVRLGANESSFGISPRAKEAMCAAVEEIFWYNDPEGYELREGLAQVHGVAFEEVCLGSGIDDLLDLCVRLFVEPGDSVATSLGAYPTFNYHVAGHGGVLQEVPYRDDREDLGALLDVARKMEPRLVYVANPDNPMGTWNRGEELREFIEQLPENSVLVLDEAYLEFGPEEALLPLDTERGNVIRVRTFSKAHGMAGARIGYAVAHREMVTAFDKVRNHFGVNRVAQAGALASLRDEAFVKSVVRQVEEGRWDYMALAEELGLGAIPSGTNFVAFDVGDGGRARALMGLLLERDVFVRMPGVAPLDRCIRVTVGTGEERSGFADALRDALPLLSERRISS